MKSEDPFITKEIIEKIMKNMFEFFEAHDGIKEGRYKLTIK